MSDNAPAQDEPPRQVSAEAVQFLRAIGREPAFLFRAIIDDPGKKNMPGYQAVTRAGTFDDHMQSLRRLNDTGYGVFVQINQASGQGWAAKDIVGATCLFVDFDGTPLENVKRLPLKPHITVETSPGKRHYYWRVDGIAIDQFAALQQRLIALFGSDKSINDLPRIMRLPGFLHQKNPDAPRLVTVTEASGAEPYQLDVFIAALDAAERDYGIAPAAQVKGKLPASISPPNANKPKADLTVAESALRYLVNMKRLDLGDRDDWIKVGLALKGTYGDDGLPLWVRLSSEAESFEGEDDCASTWGSFNNDRVEGKRLTIGTFLAIAKDNGWTKLPGDDGFDAEDSGGGGRIKTDAAVTVIDQANNAGDERFLDKDGTPYVTFRRKAGDSASSTVTASIDSEIYGGLLARRFYLDAVTKTLPAEQLKRAVSLLQAEAREAGVVHPIYQRVAAHEGRIYVDTGRGDTAIEIDAEGWREIAQAPVKFTPSDRGPLPVPIAGGALTDLERHMPSLDRAGVQTVLGFLIGTFSPTGICPMLLVSGQAGSYKTSIADMAVALIDPPFSREEARSKMPRDERDLAIQALHTHVLYYDNVSTFSSTVSDTLCTLLGGMTVTSRALYSNSGLHRISVKRPIIATCIGTPSSRGDLLSRTVTVVAKSGTARRSEEAVWAAFGADHGKLLGLVLTGVSAAIRNHQAVMARIAAGGLVTPRLADFAQFVEGAAEVLELAPGGFSAMLRDEQAGLQAETAAGHPLGDAILRHFSKPGAEPITATAANLLRMLADGSNDRERDWPNKAKVAAELSRIAAGLADLGISVLAKHNRSLNLKVFTLSATETFRPIDLTNSTHF